MISSGSLLKRTLPMLLQSAKAHRKPRWLPVAKSKVYRIPKRPEVSEEEKRELMRINNNYKTQMRAMKRFFHEDMIKEMSTLQSATSEMSQNMEAEEWERCIAINARWNEQVAAEREQRRKKELAALEEYALSRAETRDRVQQERIAKASAKIKLQKVAAEREQRRKKELAALEEYALSRAETSDRVQQERIAKASTKIKLQKELSKSFITPETIEEAIDHAIANPVDFNYAIDLKGTLYHGRETTIEPPNEDQKKTATA